MSRRVITSPPDSPPADRYRLGLRENLVQFSLLAFLTLLVGMSIGVERVALPPLAKHAFGITSLLYTVSFISAFGFVKSGMNLVAGRWSDQLGRKPLLVAGFVVGLGYPVLIITATSWVQVVVANLLLGVNQALAWTMTVTAKIDLVGPQKRGFAVGINEASGYVGVAVGGYAGGALAAAHGLRPAPYLLALAVIVVGGLVSLFAVTETLPWARQEAAQQQVAMPGQATPVPNLRRLVALTTWGDRATGTACQVGFINKFADSLVIGFLPLYLLGRHASLAVAGLVAGVYAAVWGVGQIPSGALADRLGRKPLIVGGQCAVAAGIAVVVSTGGLVGWLSGAVLMGVGTALVYPTLITVVSDVAAPAVRGGALGVYRLWRDGGYAIGPLLIAAVAATAGLDAAFWFTAALSAGSGLAAAIVMYETHPDRP